MKVVPLIIYIIASTFAVHITELIVPKFADPRDPAVLVCAYDLGTQELHSVKWYKDEQEFFRFTPRDKQTRRLFPVEGISLSENYTKIICGMTRCEVTLIKLNKIESSGYYKCEVSSEAPTFAIDKVSSSMTIVGLPREDPTIFGLHEKYYEGDEIIFKCISAPSLPPANIKIYINDEEVISDMVIRYKDSKPDQYDLVTRSAFLQIVANLQMLTSHVIIKCETRLPPSPVRSVQKEIHIKDRTPPQIYSNEKLEWLTNKGCGRSLKVFQIGLFFMIVKYL